METTTDLHEEPRGRIFAEFTRPKTISDPVIVSRYLPDNTTERIGTIYLNFSEDEDAVTYTCIDRNGRMLFPPTTDYSLAEERFEVYAKQLTVKAIEKQREGKIQEFKDRVEEIRNMREKNQNEKTKNINR